MLENNNFILNSNNLLTEDLSNVKKYDMTPKIIDYKSNEILNIVSGKLFGTENNVRGAYDNQFNTDELLALNTSAQDIQKAFIEEINGKDDVKKAFIGIRSNYIRILKILNRKVKKFEVDDQEKNNLSDFEKAVVDQFEKIKHAIIFFEHAEWNLIKDLNEENQTLHNLIENQKIKFKLPQLGNVDLNSLESANGCLNEVKFFTGTDRKDYVLKKDPFVVEKKSMKFNPFPQDSRHRQNKKIGAYGHIESKGQQFIVDGVSRQKGEQTIAKALGLDCVVKTGVCLVNGEVYTYMENAKNPMPDDEYIFYGNQPLFCLNEDELHEANNFINNKTLTVKDKNSKDLNKLNVDQNIKMKDFFMAKLVTKKTLFEMIKSSILDFICGQFDRHSGNFVVHFDKDGNAKFKLFDNDGSFQVNMSKSEMKQMFKEKVPIVPKSFVLNLLIFGASYEKYVKPELEAQIGKVGDFENGQDTSLTVRETEKRIIMLFTRIFPCLSKDSKMEQISNFCNKTLKSIYNNVHIGANENDFEKIIQGIEKDMSGPGENERLIEQLDIMLKYLKANVIDDNEISVENHGRLFLQLEPDGWFKRLLYKFFDYIKYVFYQKKGNLLSATHFKTRKYLINKQLPNCDQQLVLNEKNKIENCKLKKDDNANLDMNKSANTAEKFKLVPRLWKIMKNNKVTKLDLDCKIKNATGFNLNRIFL